MMKHGAHIAIFILGITAHTWVMAEDVIESEGTRIIGDSDMPKALYIVPWKKPALPTLSSRPVTPFVNSALSSINRDLLELRIKHYELFQTDGMAADRK